MKTHSTVDIYFATFIAIAISFLPITVGRAEEFPPMNESRKNEQAFLAAIQPILNSSGRAARFSFSASCSAQKDWAVPFPKLKLLAPSTGQTGLHAVRNIFLEERRVSIYEAKGVIYILRNPRNLALLSTRISLLRFDKVSQYNPTLAINKILSSRELVVAEQKIGMSIPVTSLDVILSPVIPTAPHLPSAIQNSSVSDALNLIAKTFGGVIFYSVCNNSPQFQIYFDGGSGYVVRR